MLGIGFDGDGQHHIGGADRAQQVDARPAGAVDQHGRGAEQRPHIMENVGDRKTRSQPETKHPLGARDQLRRGREALDRFRRGQCLQMMRKRAEQILHQGSVALDIAPLQKLRGTRAEVFGPPPHRVGVELADLVIAFKPDTLGEPGHRCGCHARAARLLARGEERDIGRMVDHPARGLLQLAR